MESRIQYKYGEFRKARELFTWAENPNKMNDRENAALLQSLNAFGVAEPLVIDEENMIIGGNHRAESIIALFGDEYDVPVIQVIGLTKDEKGKLGLALNKIHGSNDQAKLQELIGSFENPSDLIKFGFSDEDFKTLSIPVEADWATPEGDMLFEAPREIKTTPVTCPECGCKFIPEKERTIRGREKYEKQI